MGRGAASEGPASVEEWPWPADGHGHFIYLNPIILTATDRISAFFIAFTSMVTGNCAKPNSTMIGKPSANPEAAVP
jgi:hypothetical protein